MSIFIENYFREREAALLSLKSAIENIKENLAIKNSLLSKPWFSLYFNRTTGDLLSFFPHKNELEINYGVKRSHKIVIKEVKGLLNDLTPDGKRLIRTIEAIISGVIIVKSNLGSVKRELFEQAIDSKPIGSCLKLKCRFDPVATHKDIPYDKHERVVLCFKDKLIISKVKAVYEKKLTFRMGGVRKIRRFHLKTFQI